MGIFSRLFGGDAPSEQDVRELMRLVEKSLEKEGPMITVQIMASEEFKKLQKRYWTPSVVGPNGPLHDEFIALLTKVKKSGEDQFMIMRR